MSLGQRCHDEAWLVWSPPWQLGGPLDLAPLAPATCKAPACSVWWLLNVVDSYLFSYLFSVCGMKLPIVHLRFTFGWLNNPEFNDGLWPSLSWFDTCRLVNLAFRVIDGYRFWHKGYICRLCEVKHTDREVYDDVLPQGKVRWCVMPDAATTSDG